jgi:hypothetical protein
MKKYICLFIVTLLLISGGFVWTSKADIDSHTVTLEDLEEMSAGELRMLMQQMDAEVEMKTRDLRKAFANGLVEDYTPDHSGYLLFAQHYPNTLRYIENRVSLALSAKNSSAKGAVAEEIRDLPWTLFDAINVVDTIHEAFLRTDVSQQHPEWSSDHVEYHVNELSDQANREAARNQGSFARWFTEKRIRTEAARESKERVNELRAHQQDHPRPGNLQNTPNGMPGPNGHILGTAGGPNSQRGGGLDDIYFGPGGKVCTQVDTITYGPNGEVLSVTYRVVPCP